MAKRNQDLEKRLAKADRHLHTVALLLCLLFAQSLSGKEEQKRTSSFNQEWLKTLISIEISEPNKEAVPIGSGFLVQTPGKHIAMVTAKHVVFDKEKGWALRPHLAYRLNRKEGTSELFTEMRVAKRQSEGWFKSEKYDVACRLMVWQKEGSDIKAIEYSQFLIILQIEPGAPVFIIGFPMGMRSKEHAMPVLRYGIVARTDPDSILADAFVFPGNSGGPVVYAPTMPLGKGLTSNMLQRSWLVGLVSECVTCRTIDVKTQKVIREENSGLCNVTPASAILELLRSPAFVAVDMKTGNTESEQETKRTGGQQKE